MAWTTAQLDAFWQRYVTMKWIDVIQVGIQEPEFKAMVDYVRLNRLYGFSDYTGSCAFPNNKNNKFIGQT
jgi:hypothetical protein